MLELEKRMTLFQQTDREAQEEIRLKFVDDIKALDAIQANQGKFSDKFNEMQAWHEDVSNGFDNFANVQMPRLNDIVHEHINILRIAEQDHYNKINTTLQKAVDSRGELSKDVNELKDSLKDMKNLSNTIADSIIKHTIQQLSTVTKSFENEIISLKSQTESVKTSLYESENILTMIRKQSEIIMKQMSLSSDNMEQLQEKNRELNTLYQTTKELIDDISIIKSDYTKSQTKLNLIADELKLSQKVKIQTMTEQIDILGETLTKRIDESLLKLHEHYRIADEDITKSVQILSQKVKLQRGYTELDSK
jgi:hypothetical protein